MGSLRDITGQTFGRWTVLSKAESVRKYKDGVLTGTIARWRCRCSCGTERDVMAGNLLKGLSRSCGCIEAEKHHSNYVGEQFGLLKVVRTYTPETGMARAICLCACGNEKDVTVQSLLLGQTKSCGCLRKQSSKARMKQLYNQHEMIKDENHKVTSWKRKEK
jgi:hypothetical protein